MANIHTLPDQSAVEREAVQWLIKLDGDQPPSKEELQALTEWLGRSPAHRKQLSNLNHFWSNNVLTELLVPLGKHERHNPQGLLKRLYQQKMWAFNRFTATALVFMAAMSFMLFAVLKNNSWRDSNGLYLTAVGQHKSTTLTDGSVVSLNTNSQIEVEYSEHYRNIRLLQGEVHFDVAKNSQRPFRVYAGNGRVEAVGTAFSVYLKNNNTNVLVSEGSVALASLGSNNTGAKPSLLSSASDVVDPYVNSHTNKLGVLKAKQSFTFKVGNHQQQTQHEIVEEIELVSDDEIARRQAWRNGLLVFSGEPLKYVVEEISRYTTVFIEITDPTVQEIQIGGRFRVGDIDDMLSALETNFDLKVTRLDFNRVALSASL